MNLKAEWDRLSARFTQLQPRERILVAAAILVGIGFGSYSLLIEPAALQASALERQATQQRQEIATLTTQVQILRQQVRDPDAPMRTSLDQTKQQLTAVDNGLHQFDGMLVQPSKMPRLLQVLLAQHRRLELVSLRTLPAGPLQPAAAPANQSGQQIAQPAKAPDTPAKGAPGTLYKHGIELKVAGPYVELLAYVEELERMSPRPLWSSMSLKVVEYPRSELTLTLYTLSLDLPWLTV